jgi:hypothetical protein
MHGTLPTPVTPLRRNRGSWTLKEHEVVVSHWPDIGQIRLRLPYRSVHAIRNFASRCNLRREIHVWTAEQTALLKRRVRELRTREQIAKEMGFTRMQVQNRCQYLGLVTGKRPPQLTGNRLMDAIYLRAFELNISRKDLDEACRSGGQFQKWSPARRIAITHIIKALKVLDGQLTVEWSALDAV